MRSFSLSHLSDPALQLDLASRVATERAATAGLLAALAEVDARRLYAPAGHPSMLEHCVHVLGMSEDSAFRRIRVARTARRFPGIFEALSDGQLNLTSVLLLTPHLTEGNARELLAAAANMPKSEIETLIAQRFPRTELLPLVVAVPATAPVAAPVRVNVTASTCQLAPALVSFDAPNRGSRRARHGASSCDSR
jgi:hypothetical protein